jgi:hypothetical protein
LCEEEVRQQNPFIPRLADLAQHTLQIVVVRLGGARIHSMLHQLVKIRQSEVLLAVPRSVELRLNLPHHKKCFPIPGIGDVAELDPAQLR